MNRITQRDKRTSPSQPQPRGRPPQADQLRALQRTLARRPERAFDIGLLLGAVVAVLTVVVIVENGERVGFDILWWTWTTRLWVALAAATSAGVLIGLLIPVAVRRQRTVRLERRQARTALGQLGGTGATPPGRPANPERPTPKDQEKPKGPGEAKG